MDGQQHGWEDGEEAVQLCKLDESLVIDRVTGGCFVGEEDEDIPRTRSHFLYRFGSFHQIFLLFGISVTMDHVKPFQVRP